MSSADATIAPLVEVMVPFVSGTAHLLDAIRSVRTQTVSEWQLTVVDNAGPEPEAQAQIEAMGDDRIRYARFDDHLSMADNWNRAIAHARASWVVLLHADDEWEPGYLSEIHRMIRVRSDSAACFTGGHTIGPDGSTRFSLADTYKRWLLGRGDADLVLAEENGISRLLRGNFVFASSICLNRNVVGAAPYDTGLRFAPDYELVLRLLLDGCTMTASRADVCRYRRHPGQATLALTKAAQRFDEEQALYRSSVTACRERGWYRAARTARRHTSLRVNLLLHGLAAIRTDRSSAVDLLRRSVAVS